MPFLCHKLYISFEGRGPDSDKGQFSIFILIAVFVKLLFLPLKFESVLCSAHSLLICFFVVFFRKGQILSDYRSLMNQRTGKFGFFTTL